MKEAWKDSRKEMYDKSSLLAQISIEGDKEHKDTSRCTAKDFHIDGTTDTKKVQVDVKKR